MTKVLVLPLVIVTLRSVVTYKWTPKKINEHLAMKWIDGNSRIGRLQIDTFFDRVVPLYVYNPKLNQSKIDWRYGQMYNQVTGVYITEKLILTSFNPFRRLAMYDDKVTKIRSFVPKGRLVDNTTRTIYLKLTGSLARIEGNVLNRIKIVCGRQVVPVLPNNTWPTDDMKHGIHYPLHDLMVMRMDPPRKFLEPIPQALNSFSDYQSWQGPDKRNLYYKEGFFPIKTILAEPDDMPVREDMQFVSLGHLNDLHVELSSYLEKGKFGKILDCEEWIPREWGFFICLENTKQYPGLAAGALLFSGEKLFGVGAFALNKKNGGILVFTDVRPYWHLIYRTCTEDEQKRG